MDDKQLYKLAHEVATAVLSYRDTNHSLNDNRHSDINPAWNQTESGLFLELYYGVPGQLWTPWGQWNCWGGGYGHWESKIEAILERFGAVEYRSLDIRDDGEYGPVYALTRVNGTQLPPAIERKFNDYIKAVDAHRIWKSLASL